MKIKIDDVLLSRLKEYQKQTSFKNIDDLIGYILTQYLDSTNTDSNKPDSKSDSDELNERLKNLGYL